jgi:hypothetical protein
LLKDKNCHFALSRLGDDWVGVTSPLAWYARINLLENEEDPRIGCVIGLKKNPAKIADLSRFSMKYEMGPYWVLTE